MTKIQASADLFQNAFDLVKNHKASPIDALDSFAQENGFKLVSESRTSALDDEESDTYTYRDTKAYHMKKDDQLLGLDFEQNNEGFRLAVFDFKNSKKFLMYNDKIKTIGPNIEPLGKVSPKVINQIYRIQQ